MINYVLYQNKNRESRSYGKWFSRAVHQLVEFNEFVDHMARHHCVYSEGTIRGVLIEMEVCLRELLLDGKAVRFDDLGIFAIGIDNAKGGAVSAFEYNTAKNIAGVHMNLYLGKRFLARELYKDSQFREQKLYDVDSSKPQTEPGGETAGGSNGSPNEGDIVTPPDDSPIDD